MIKHFSFAKWFLLITFLINISENYAVYRPPSATVQPLHPTGLRVSIPDEDGITLVAFHIKFNEDFDGLEAGHIAKDILKVRNEQWTYEDRRTQLKRDDIIYYWIHVVYQGLGYNLIDQSHRVIDFYTYAGALVPQSIENVQNCVTKSATWIFENGKRRQACSGELIFEDNFDDLNTTNWNTLNRMSTSPDEEFVVYITNDVTDVNEGKLRISPILLESKHDSNFISQGTLILENCSGQPGTNVCERYASGFYILPPIISGRINTKGKFEFLFGRIEIRAKLPHGDWVYPLIMLESPENMLQMDISREIRIASSVGNEELSTSNGKIVNGRILTAGGFTKLIGRNNTQNLAALPKRRSSTLWSNDFHTFVIEWKSGLVTVKVDNVEYGEQTVDGSYGKPSYLTLGVAVGGVNEFGDHLTSGGYVKPWRNVESKALLHFYRAKDHWYPTWDTRTVLQVDYVKVWAL
ncbi:hypothetical protein PUN28_020077 [Cardiocondyla obscurior]|uniref:Uncharacterized protein n=1 Tax=Cardiocondyla obscurior TaxID=286306 RepID=A0AAW2EAB3_9HYME